MGRSGFPRRPEHLGIWLDPHSTAGRKNLCRMADIPPLAMKHHIQANQCRRRHGGAAPGRIHSGRYQVAEFDVDMTSKSARAATDPNGPTGRLATWLADTKLNDVPASVREHAKHLLLDGIACALVGAQLPVSRKGVEGVTALDSAGSALLIGWGSRTTSAPSAAMLNSSFIQGFELDDYHPIAPLHSNSLVLPAMLAAAPHVGRVSGARFLLGAILGYETGPRVGQALGGLEMISRGWHSGVVFGTLSAAASAGALYGLDAAGFEDALGMAATQSCGLMSAQFESMVKRMQHGFAARNGLTAAALAAAGYVGIQRVFERPYGGYLTTFGQGHDTDATAIYEGPGAGRGS